MNKQSTLKVNKLLPQGLAFQQQGKLPQAQAIYEKVLQLQPSNFDALQLLGVLSTQKKDNLLAIEFYSKALQINPQHAASYNNLGVVFHEQKRFDEAIKVYERAIAIAPKYADAYYNRGNALKELERFEEALASYEESIALVPNHAEAYLGKGIALKDLKRIEEALLCYEKAININPEYTKVYFSQGVALHSLGRLEEALIHYDKAISIKSNYVDAHCNRGVLLGDLGRTEDASESLKKAISLAPNNALANFNLALCNLQSGNFKDGWNQYECRWESFKITPKNGARTFTQPLWLGGKSIQDKTILLHSEQGLGDTLQFCRYASLVANLGATVILEVQAPLVKLLSNLKGVSKVIASGDPLPQFDYQCPLLSLPLAFKTELDSIPASPKYLVSDEKKLAHWQAILGEKKLPRVGVVWSGNAGYGNDINRSIGLNDLIDHLPDNCEYVSLQKEIRDADRQMLTLNKKIRHFGGAFQDFLDTAALCDSMDLVISVDTSVAHLAGALGKPTWIMLPHNSDWRWLLEREDSPWYPSVKLYRKPTAGSWDFIMKRIQSDLKEITSKN
jgi:tetratricopeptide (TPR) repeat protein